LKKNENASLKDQMRALERTRIGRLRAKQNALNDISTLAGNKEKVLNKMRATSVDFLRPKEAKNQLDHRDGWYYKLKSQFSEDAQLFLEEEFDELECIGLPKLSHLVQQEFYRAVRTLRYHELQDPNMKSAIEYTRDLLCINEIDFDQWLEQHMVDQNNNKPPKYYTVATNGEIKENTETIENY